MHSVAVQAAQLAKAHEEEVQRLLVRLYPESQELQIVWVVYEQVEQKLITLQST